MSKIRDTDYLTISARVRAMENRLVTRERMERMVEARSDDEAVKVLAECGYEELPALTNRGLDELLSAARAALYRELGGAVPDKRLVELFQMKYDYHNAKALVKGAAVGADADRLLMEGGRWSAAQVKEAFQRDSLREFTGPFRRAVVQARETLNGGNDPQLAAGAALTAPGSGELTAFERLCDDAVMGYLAQARRIPFGEQAVVGYLYAREAEFTAIRTILSGRMAGLDADTIRERLREAYV